MTGRVPVPPRSLPFLACLLIGLAATPSAAQEDLLAYVCTFDVKPKDAKVLPVGAVLAFSPLMSSGVVEEMIAGQPASGVIEAGMVLEGRVKVSLQWEQMREGNRGSR